MSKYKLDKYAQVVENQNYIMTQEEVCKRLNDLEAKLADAEFRYDNLHNLYYKDTEELKQQLEEKELEAIRWEEHFNNAKMDYECLQEQLAEKEEQIKKLNNIILISQLQAPEEQRLKIIGSSCCQYNPHQDKISFAVEQILDIKEKSFGTRKTGIIFDIPKTQDVFNNIEDKLKELMGDKYDW